MEINGQTSVISLRVVSDCLADPRLRFHCLPWFNRQYPSFHSPSLLCISSLSSVEISSGNPGFSLVSLVLFSWLSLFFSSSFLFHSSIHHLHSHLFISLSSCLSSSVYISFKFWTKFSLTNLLMVFLFVRFIFFYHLSHFPVLSLFIIWFQHLLVFFFLVEPFL